MGNQPHQPPPPIPSHPIPFDHDPPASPPPNRRLQPRQQREDRLLGSARVPRPPAAGERPVLREGGRGAHARAGGGDAQGRSVGGSDDGDGAAFARHGDPGPGGPGHDGGAFAHGEGACVAYVLMYVHKQHKSLRLEGGRSREAEDLKTPETCGDLDTAVGPTTAKVNRSLYVEEVSFDFFYTSMYVSTSC